MIAKLFYTIIDTNNLSFDSEINITTSEYETMLVNKINENSVILNGSNGQYANCDLNYNHHSLQNEKRNIEKYRDIPCEAFVSLVDNNEIDINYFLDCVKNEKMSLLNININPNNLDYDVYSDLKQWLSESNSIKNIANISEKDKIGLLPFRNMSIEIENTIFSLENAKVIRDNSDKNFPFNFIILIEKIMLKKNI